MTFLKVYGEDGYILVRPECEPALDAAVTAYLDSGGIRDTLVHLTGISGDEYVTRASRITSWLISTPEGRMRETEIEKALADEHTANRHAVGLWDDE